MTWRAAAGTSAETSRKISRPETPIDGAPQLDHGCGILSGNVSTGVSSEEVEWHGDPLLTTQTGTQSRSWPTLAKPTLAKTDFGQNRLCVVRCVVVWCVVCVCCVAWVLVSRFHGVGFHVWVLVSRFGLDRPSPGPPFPWTALLLDRPKFRSFFSLPRRKIRSFLPSLGVFSLNFGGVFEGRALKCARLGSLVVVWNPGGFGGFTRQPENSKRAHLSAPALQTPPKFNEKTPREGRKERILGREKEKKARNFGPPTLRAPTLRDPTFSGFGPPPFGPPTLLAPAFSGFGPLAYIKKTKQLTQKIQTS